ncbi:Uncharacterized metal-binding protein YceD, DUF177 family [Sphingomonas gellani]|uniref:Uncharacterized metal-binding protein YceD, DUF177 family n=1 Tax=Sphingomonas gellani TaxID=1166340 RepID=A0A1H8H659_9SPHN|nr:DUF177 domain-containing protein [Sphingomonas gellani]SEN51499.1 Uncharacterized metal-binding protein YceD, DUF177 family [Sphingomonas gellani]
MTPEFARPQRLDTIGDREREVVVEADDAERRALATRFGLIGIDRLEGHFTIRRDTNGVSARGRVVADVVQPCSASGAPLPAHVDEPVALMFVEPGTDTEEVELSADALDTMEIENGAIDLGEAAAETMALALDPFVRGPDADAALKAAGVLGEGEAGPFGGLAALKDKLAGR